MEKVSIICITSGDIDGGGLVGCVVIGFIPPIAPSSFVFDMLKKNSTNWNKLIPKIELNILKWKEK